MPFAMLEPGDGLMGVIAFVPAFKVRRVRLPCTSRTEIGSVNFDDFCRQQLGAPG